MIAVYGRLLQSWHSPGLERGSVTGSKLGRSLEPLSRLERSGGLRRRLRGFRVWRVREIERTLGEWNGASICKSRKGEGLTLSLTYSSI